MCDLNFQSTVLNEENGKVLVIAFLCFYGSGQMDDNS